MQWSTSHLFPVAQEILILQSITEPFTHPPLSPVRKIT